MKQKIYSILSLAVEEGIRIGYRHAHKHTDHPGEDVAIGNIHSMVMDSIADYFSFDDAE
jgi:hypothetical protein